MKKSTLLTGSSVVIFLMLILILSSSVQAQNQRESTCLDDLRLAGITPTIEQRAQCKVEGKSITEGDSVLGFRHHDPIFNISQFKAPAEIVATFLNTTAVQANTLPFAQLAPDVEFREVLDGGGDRDNTKIEVWGGGGSNFLAGLIRWCTIDLVENNYQKPFDCIETPGSNTAPYYHVVVSPVGIAMKRVRTASWGLFGYDASYGTWGSMTDGTIYRWTFRAINAP